MYAKLTMLKTKAASAMAKAWSKAKGHIESLSDPGGIHHYKIQRVGRDPGKEFKAEFGDSLMDDNIPLEEGAVDRHTDQSIQENRHKMLRLATSPGYESVETNKWDFPDKRIQSRNQSRYYHKCRV